MFTKTLSLLQKQINFRQFKKPKYNMKNYLLLKKFNDKMLEAPLLTWRRWLTIYNILRVLANIVREEKIN